MALTLVEHVVADAGAFLKKAPLQEIGRNVYTVRDVVDEIRDKATRRSLAVLPYQLIFREPHPEHIRHVTEFSKKTGDYPSLSATDIKVLALTYQLELEHVGSQHLKKEPDLKVNIVNTQHHPEAPVNVAGFHFPSKVPDVGRGDGPDRSLDPVQFVSHQKPADGPNVQNQMEERRSDPVNVEQFNSFQFWRDPVPTINEDLLDLLSPVLPSARSAGSAPVSEPKQNQTDSVVADSQQFNSFQFWRDPVLTIDDELLDLLEGGGASAQMGESEGHSDDEDKENEPEVEDDDDGGGWITPSNIKQMKMESSDWTAPADVRVGCLTTDFAMQNVLLQIGLHVLSVNGMLIRQARNYILRCHACFKTTSNMNKVFCPHCGNRTLKKVAVTVSADSGIHMHFSRNPKVLNPRGLRHSLPLPEGGKHANNPHLVEDQRFPQQRLSRKARQKTDVFDPDYVAGLSPFSENDVYSRAANLHIRDSQCGGGRRRANPNAARRKFIKK
ncbi:RNA-binding protein NOB1 [Melanotaenia boesemani]|uniref:RNA-binding protein NOB1 n=1 Tax=Melanotaenia boesemani TaxID=1250792 RepID=UPI001C057A9D|nr:RNA-binding protein NOB1 [Melanotaenia boesemani]